MNIRLIIIFFFVLPACLISCSLPNEATESEAPQSQSVAPFIEDEAEVVLRRMSDFLAKAERFSFESRQLVDEVSESGQNLLLLRSGQLSVHRTNRFRAEFTSDLFSNLVIHDGELVIWLDRLQNVYATLAAEMTSEEAVDLLVEQYGLVMPLADITAGSPYDSFVNSKTSGVYVGLHQVDGVRCHHLAFTDEAADWQIWISEEGDPVPRLLKITYRNVPSQPQFLSYLDNWDFPAEFTEGTFGFIAPEEAEEILFYEDLFSGILSGDQ